MNKWSRNSIYGAGLASLLYLGCGNSVQNIDTKVQEDTDLSLADKNLDDFYQPTDSSLEDIVNPNPNNEYEESTDIPVYIDAMDLDMDILTCIVSNGPANNYNSCNNIINVRFFATGEKEIWTWAEDTCKNQSNAYIIPVNIISKE